MLNKIYVNNVVRGVLLVIQKITVQIAIHFISYLSIRRANPALNIASIVPQPQSAKIATNIFIYRRINHLVSLA